jgi:cytochrome b involved in lipid metabolism
MRGKDAPGERMLRITPAQLKRQNGRKGRDAWTVYQGKVYNITPYIPFHPGGAGEILRGAGKDSVKLFMEVHPWVNWDGMLSECMVGILVSDEEIADTTSGGLDEMD